MKPISVAQSESVAVQEARYLVSHSVKTPSDTSMIMSRPLSVAFRSNLNLKPHFLRKQKPTSCEDKDLLCEHLSHCLLLHLAHSFRAILECKSERRGFRRKKSFQLL